MQPLVVVGAGGLGREVAEAVKALNAQVPTWDLLGFLDDAPELLGQDVAGLPVLGPVSAAVSSPAKIVVALASPADLFARRRVVDRLGLGDDRYGTVVHPRAMLASSTVLGPGSVLLAGAVTTADVTIGAHVVCMAHAVLTHDDVVGDFVTLASAACLAGVVGAEEGVDVGSGAVVRERRTIGAWSLVGMGSVVTTDVPAGEVWAGCPARFLRRVEAPPASGTAS